MENPEQPTTPPDPGPTASAAAPTIPAVGAGGPPAASPGGQDGIAVAGFVCGLIGLLTTWCLLGIPLAILGIVFGAMGRTRNAAKGASTALPTAGLVCGIVGLVLLVVLIVVGATVHVGGTSNS